jgi:hypothetical protein
MKRFAGRFYYSNRNSLDLKCSIALVHLMTANNSAISEKVVIQFGTRMVKGYLESPVRNTIEELLTDAPVSAPETFRIHLLESDTIEEISIKDIKAVFYVHSFDGDTKHKALNFYGKSPVVHGIWMMIRFLDGEVMEGIVHNSIRYLVDPGFFLLPTDPCSNNKLVYVAKSQLSDHQVLGIRNFYATDTPCRK